MKHILIIALSLGLVACGQTAETTAPSPGPKPGDPGSYTRTLDDGTPVTVVIREDGTLLRKVGDEFGTGTVRVTGDEICFRFADDADQEYCWKNGPIQADGTFESIGPNGEKLTITYSPEMQLSGAPSVLQPGLYATGDGTQVYSRTRINADGTYVDLNDAMEPVGNGTWEQRGELLCFDPEGDGKDQQEMCWTNSEPQEDGSVISTSVDGSMSYTVTPIEEPEADVGESD